MIKNGIIVSPVSIEDVMQVLNEQSTDVSTLCESGKINIAARYKPMPAPFLSLERERSELTESERLANGYGIVSFYDPADIGQENLFVAVRNALNAGTPVTDLSVRKRDWAATSFHRLTDFVSTEKPNDKGYKHDAKFYSPVYRHFSGPVYSMGGRIIQTSVLDLEEGTEQRFDIPDDTFYLRLWKGLEGTGYTVENEDPNSLTITDAIANSVNLQIGYEMLDENSVRGVVVMYHNDLTGHWVFFGVRVRRRTGDPVVSYNGNDIDFASTVTGGSDGVEARIVDGNIVDGTPSGSSYATWHDLKGRCAFVEFYRTGRGDIPIPGYCYEVQINRYAHGYGTVDVEGVFMFFVERTSDASNSGMHFRIRFYDIASATWSTCRSRLRDYFDSLDVYFSPNADGVHVFTPTLIDVLNAELVDDPLTDANGLFTVGFSPDSGASSCDIVCAPKNYESILTGTNSGYFVVRGKKKGVSSYAYKVSEDAWTY